MPGGLPVNGDAVCDVFCVVHRNSNAALTNVKQTVVDLHGQCDFIIANFDERKEKREGEIEGLAKAKSVLQGAKID